ncbi:MAG TPA: hypothetical protein VKB88_10670 [Bryobacteraceae bacterium]|nr:hypothetical protein [Bryobacteraceae bacterium]
MRFPIALALLLCAAAYADVITLKNGRVVNGTYLGGDSRQVKVAEGDQVETFQVSEIVKIVFGNGDADVQAPSNRPVLRRAPGSSDNAPPPDYNDGRPTLRRADSSSSSSSSDDGRPTLRRADSGDGSYGPNYPQQQGSGSGSYGPNYPAPRNPSAIMRPDAEPSVSSMPQQAPPPPAPVQLSAGTNLVVRMIDAVDSEKANVGQTFRASMDEPVAVNGDTVIPRGSDVVVKLVDAKDSGRATGRAELTLSLQSIIVNGKTVDINSQNITKESGSRGVKTAKAAGIGAAVGTIIGAAAGGGKGAAIGAGAGAATGAGVEMASKGEKVKVPSETRLTFVLDSPVNI